MIETRRIAQAWLYLRGLIARMFKRILGYAQSGVKSDYALECRAAIAKKDRRIKELENELGALRAQVANIRVSQAQEGRAGWEVMAYIPEVVIKWAQEKPEHKVWLIDRIVRGLVEYALQGIVKVDSNGKVNALVFAPLDINGPAEAPKWVMALFHKDGKFKLSERAWITPETEEQKIRRMR